MDVPRGRWRARTRLAGLLFFAVAAAAAILLVLSDEAFEGERGTALGPVLLVLAAGAALLAAWQLERDTTATRQERADELAREAEREKAEARERVERAERELSGADSRVREAERRVQAESERANRIDTERRMEREWHREMRQQLVETHHSRGVLGDLGDVRALVLHVAVTLLEAEKGLLLARSDADGDGDLDLVAYEGFDNDPEHAAIAQRFADRVLERDETIREDSPRQAGGGRGADADAEIENLVAIPIYIREEFSGVVICANREGGFEEWDDDVLLALGDHAGAVLDNNRLHGELRGAYLGTVRVLAEAIQAKDPFLRGHSEEVSGYVAAVADRLGVDSRRREELVFGSLLHDVGKIGISERILLKPGKLTPEERTLIELHPRIGYRLVEQVPALRPIAGAILHHHERFDGGGYPEGLAGDSIPLEARIICVADSFSAMTAERPYRGRMSLAEACAELERCAGTQFDPDVVRAFVEEVRRDPFSGDGQAAAAMEDPLVDRHREGDEPVLGFGAHAIVDNLTLLYGHRYFHESAQAAADRAAAEDEPFAIVLAELTEIAHLNRLEGYTAGDEAIRSAAKAIQRAAVLCGGTACRASGRRLAVVAPATSEEQAMRLASMVAGDLADGPRVAIGCAVWRPGDTGFDVVARARLAVAPVPATAA
ncbi:MAG TPA: HD domain-containing phosphohydrolase [Thermoleophilaceae bacterium]|jgi:HD-GYP domain-containing protein (c-di-GMP phosphodiesterase class II)